jgi:hypothetical protein
MAKSKYTAKHLYASNACRDDLAEYDELETNTKRNWEMVAREHDEQQLNIFNSLITFETIGGLELGSI